MKSIYYIDRDNYYLMSLTLDGIAFNLLSATDIELRHSGGSIKRSDSPNVFTADGQNVRINLGKSDLAAGLYRMHIVIYTASWPLGMVWGQTEMAVQEA